MPAGRPTSSDGFLLLHAWLEGDSAEPLRVRVTAVHELDGPRVDMVATASVTVAVECVREWLERLVSSNLGPGETCPSGELL